MKEKIYISDEVIQCAYERYQSDVPISEIALSLGVSSSSLRQRFNRRGLLLRKHKKYSGKVTAENSNAELLEKNRKARNPDLPRLCANCKHRIGGRLGNKHCDGCYGTPGKPKYETDKTLFAGRKND